jgi:hypothetical protein
MHNFLQAVTGCSKKLWIIWQASTSDYIALKDTMINIGL